MSAKKSGQTQARRRSVPFKPASCDAGFISASTRHCLGLHSQAADGFLAGVEISDAQLKALQLAASKAGKSLSEILAHGCDLVAYDGEVKNHAREGIVSAAKKSAGKGGAQSRARKISGSIVILEIEPELEKQLRIFGRSCLRTNKDDLPKIAYTALSVAMMNRPFIQEAAYKFVRYAKAEGFNDQQPLIKARLEALR